MFGSLVVKQPAQTDPNSHLYDCDLPQHVIIVTDWHHETFFTKWFTFMHINHNEDNNIGDAILLNGKGQRLDADYLFSDYEIFEVKEGQRYRFRGISTGLFSCQLELSIDGHVITLISTDGYPVQPYNVTSVYFDGGETYDFVVHADRKLGNYWMRIEVGVCVFFYKTLAVCGESNTDELLCNKPNLYHILWMDVMSLCILW